MTNNHKLTIAGRSLPAIVRSQIAHNDTDVEEAVLLMRNMRISDEHYDEYAAVLNTVFRRSITKELDKQ